MCRKSIGDYVVQCSLCMWGYAIKNSNQHKQLNYSCFSSGKHDIDNYV